MEEKKSLHMVEKFPVALPSGQYSQAFQDYLVKEAQKIPVKCKCGCINWVERYRCKLVDQFRYRDRIRCTSCKCELFECPPPF